MGSEQEEQRKWRKLQRKHALATGVRPKTVDSVVEIEDHALHAKFKLWCAERGLDMKSVLTGLVISAVGQRAPT